MRSESENLKSIKSMQALERIWNRWRAVATATASVNVNDCSTKMRLYTVYYVSVNCSLYMFRVVTSPIIRSTCNCNYNIWHWSNRLCYLPLSWSSWNCSSGLLDHDQQRSNHHAPTVKPEAPSAVVRSWRCAGRRPKHVEPHINVK